VEKNINQKTGPDTFRDLSDTEITGVFIMDMIGHNRDNDLDVFQISPGKGSRSLIIAREAHIANEIWNSCTAGWNKSVDRLKTGRGKRISDKEQIPGIAEFLNLVGEIRTFYNPHSSLFNTDCQIFSDTGVPVVLFMENYDINRSGYHDSKDTMENIDLDYGAALAAIAIESVARVASVKTFQ
jgi:Zn-dependent M28 family amino/carboxypeptidase